MIRIKNGKAKFIRPWWIDENDNVIIMPQMYITQKLEGKNGTN